MIPLRDSFFIGVDSGIHKLDVNAVSWFTAIIMLTFDSYSLVDAPNLSAFK